MSTFPTSLDSFTTKSAAQTIQPAHINDLQSAVVAVETALLTPQAYVPIWTNTGTANTLGAGQLSGTYLDLGKFVIAQIFFTWAADTVSGNGAWVFTTPVTGAALVVATSEAVGMGIARDASAGNYVVGAGLTSTTTVVPFAADVISNGLGATVPFAWVANDSLSLIFLMRKA